MDYDDEVLHLLEQWEELRGRGAAPAPEELCRDCPGRLDDLRRAIRDLEALGPVLGTNGANSDTHPPGQSPNGAPPAPPDGAFAGLRYRPLRFHRRGGQGEVFVAKDEELNREVALKRVQDRHRRNAVVHRRFLQEAEINGRLEHPGIVPVYGLGTDAEGRPYYAMRLIQGESLQDAIQRFHHSAGESARDPGARTLLFRQLLQRFVAVCNAVAYAHSRGIVHRDLKPANVMLGRYGETLVVDWGLAKPVGRGDDARDKAVEETLWPRYGDGDSGGTQTGAVVGTLAYMSPEQARGEVALLSPASDIYSLGATLYTLLTGQAPVGGEDMVTDLERVQRGEVRPARAVKPDVPAALDAVCRKAMALKPGARYASAQDLAADVERWLADEPVVAWREPWGIWAGRRLRRHRTLVTTATSVIVLTAVGLAVGLAAVERERQAAARQRDAARALKHQMRQAIDDMLGDESLGWLTAQKELLPQQRAFLERALTYYQQFAAQAEDEEQGRRLAALAHFRVGRIFQMLGRPADAEPAYRSAIDLQGRLVNDRPAAAEYRQDLAHSYTNLGVLLAGLGRQADAEAADRAAVALGEQLTADFPDVPEYRADLALGRNNLGKLLAGAGRRSEAETEYRAAVATQQKLADDVPAVPLYRQDLARTRSNLGLLLADLGRRAEAETELRAALAIRAKLAAEFPAAPQYRADLAVSHHNLAVVLGDLGRWAEAEAAYRAARAVRVRLVDEFPAVPQYRQELATSQNNLGSLLADLGKRGEAEAEYRAALAVQEKLVTDHPAVPQYRQEQATTWLNLGVVLAAAGRRPEAAAAYRSALAAQQKLAAEFPDVPGYRADLALSRNNLGNLLKGLGRRAEAEAEYRAAAALQERLAADHPGVPQYRQELATSHHNLGVLLAGSGRRSEAESEYHAALALREKLAADHPNVPQYRLELVPSYNTLALLLRDGGNPQAALGWLDRAVETLTPLVAQAPRAVTPRQYLRNTLQGRARTLEQLGRYAAALADWDQALALADGPAPPAWRLARALCLARAGQPDRAVTEAEELSRQPGATADLLYDCACAVALAAAAGGDAAVADRRAARAVELLRQAVAQGYKDVANMTKDPDLAALRGRADFRELLKGLPPSAGRPGTDGP